jgi:hypothetical protein
MNTLEGREAELISKLSQSTQQRDKLKMSLDKKHLLNLHELEEFVVGGTLETKTSRATSVNSTKDMKRSLLQGRSRPRLDLNQYKKNKDVISKTIELSNDKPKSSSTK